jgi:hypothetical protein
LTLVHLHPFAVAFQEFKIQNIVGSCDVKFPIRLEGLAYSHGYFATVSRGRVYMLAGWRVLDGSERAPTVGAHHTVPAAAGHHSMLCS